MALEIYFVDDLTNSLAAICCAMLLSAKAHGRTNVEYMRGVLDTTCAHALNYGIPWSGMLQDIKALMQANGIEVLDVPGLLEG